MMEPDSLATPLYMFWEPFVGSKMDIWDVWRLQIAIVTALTFQGIMTIRSQRVPVDAC